MSASKSTLFLGDLSTFCTERDIHAAFSPYGEIIEIKIMRSEETYRNLSYGFIKFAHPGSAKKAMNGLNGVLFCGRNLRIGWASYKSKKEPKTLLHHDRIESSSVHVSYISYQLKNLITEESLRILFSQYGVVLDTSIKKSYIDESINRQCGYGFVHFSSSQEGIESALAAVAGLNDATLENVCYKCSISHNLEKYLLDLQSQRIEHLQDNYRNSGSPISVGEVNTQSFNFPYHASDNERKPPVYHAANSRQMEWSGTPPLPVPPSHGTSAPPRPASYRSANGGGIGGGCSGPDALMQSIDQTLVRSYRNKYSPSHASSSVPSALSTPHESFPSSPFSTYGPGKANFSSTASDRSEVLSCAGSLTSSAPCSSGGLSDLGLHGELMPSFPLSLPPSSIAPSSIHGHLNMLDNGRYFDHLLHSADERDHEPLPVSGGGNIHGLGSQLWSTGLPGVGPQDPFAWETDSLRGSQSGSTSFGGLWDRSKTSSATVSARQSPLSGSSAATFPSLCGDGTNLPRMPWENCDSRLAPLF